MRVPLSWLAEYVDLTLDVEELAERLTLAGLEVAGIERVGADWDRDKIFVGEVVAVRPHPNADRLTLVTVRYGEGLEKEVVTGAPNLKVGDHGQKVAFAIAGARLIDGHADDGRVLTLKPTKIRGVLSDGMVCSEKELGLGPDHSGILILPDDAPVGRPLADYLGDTVLDLDLTPNLARCLSMIGVAREVAALTGQRVRLPSTDWVAEGEAIAGQVEVEIDDPDLCNRYVAALIKGVQHGPSPYRIQRRLILAGMRPISVIVDITNYVMLEWGQPLHAFDYRRLRNRQGQTVDEAGPDGEPPVIIVRRARPGERIVTLDGVARELTEEMLVIADGVGPVAIAGVMGGLDTEVTEATTDILLESANFDFISNRRTAQALRLPSEASYRFGRGVPASLSLPAARRAAEMMRQLAGGTIAQGVVDNYPVPQKQVTVHITPAEVRRILGVDLATDDIVGVLEGLEFRCQVEGDPSSDQAVIHAQVPDHRLDVHIPADLIEEVARIYGYDRLPETLMADSLPPQRRNLALEGEELVRDILAGAGLQEVITYSLTNLASVARLNPDGPAPDPEGYIRLANPLTAEREFLRQTLMNGLLETAWANLRHEERVALFEVGSVYLPKEGELLPEEPRRVGIVLAGPREPLHWQRKDVQPLDYFDLKGVVEALLGRLGVQDVDFVPTEHPTFEPGRVALLRHGDATLGVLGEVHPRVREAFDLPEDLPVALAELDLEALLALAQPVPLVEPVSRFEIATEDLAFIVAGDMPAERVRRAIVEAGGRLLRRVVLFDVYTGEPIPPGHKSLAFSLTLQADDHTLTGDEIAQVRQRIVRRVERQLGARLRST
ncbi:MAG: phenylalanine--tRNA ligase subunit beta [Anaerolineae bacterium]|nr:phenylalanine--tRNA ligase subunit beta [Anaerolineae bacterium]